MIRKQILMSIFIMSVLCGCSAQKEKEIPVIEMSSEEFATEDRTESEDELAADMEEVITSEEVPRYMKVENVGFEAYCEEGRTASEHKLTLTTISEKANLIIDEEDWFEETGMYKPEATYCDDNYSYWTYGDNSVDTRYLVLTDLEGEKGSLELDFEDYNYAPDYNKADEEFVFQRIAYARVMDDVLYVETAHPTYASSYRQNAFITAIDMKDFHTLWKTGPLTANAYTFAVYDDFIITGYGFTDEPDALHIVDKYTGKVVESYPIKSMAEYIMLRDDVLYVRTYDTNYEFKLELKKCEYGINIRD